MVEITRRNALGVIALPAAAMATGGGALAQTPATTFTLLLVNDIYKMADDKGRGGFARLNAIVKSERAKAQSAGVPLVYAHAGDCYSPSIMSGFDQGAHIVELMNIAPPDIFVPGNHEFDFGKDNYAKRRAEAKYPFFAANLRDAADKPLPGHEDGRVVQLGPVKVGLLGLALENTPQISSTGDLQFMPVMDTLRRQVQALKSQGADMIVAVAHTDRAVDNAIVRSRLVDVLLSGHDHDLAVAYDGRTVMVESNEEGYYVTAIDIAATVAGEGSARRVTWSPTFRINDSRAVTPDPDTLAIVKKYESELSKELDIEIGVTAVELDSRSATVRSQEAAIGNLIADAIRDATGAQVAITNGGGIRANKQYPAGAKLTRRDVLSELPFGNSTVMVEITGADIVSALENGVSQVEQRAGRFPHTSGLKVEVDAKRPAGTRIVSVMVGDAPLDPAAKYKVASNNFMFTGGDGYTALGLGRTLIGETDGKLMANEVMTYVRKLGTVNAKVEGRIILR